MRFSFIRAIAFNRQAIGSKELDTYVEAYSQPGAMRASFGWLREFGAFSSELERISCVVDMDGRPHIFSHWLPKSHFGFRLLGAHLHSLAGRGETDRWFS